MPKPTRGSTNRQLVNLGPAVSIRVNQQHASQVLTPGFDVSRVIPSARIVTRSAGVNPACDEVLIRGELVRRDASALMRVTTGRGDTGRDFHHGAGGHPAAIAS